MQLEWMYALIGGAVIGGAVSLMLVFNGRVTGISGIVNGTLHPIRGDTLWRWYFLGGMLVGGLTVRVVNPSAFSGQLDTNMWIVGLAGLLVGFGTILGSGCTSGHGVCGISRMSSRSLVSTVVFICAGIVCVAALRSLGVLP